MAAKTFPQREVPTKRHEVGQLFTPSSPVTVAELFAGRADQMQRINETIAERGRHAIIFGERGVGKTSLAQVIPYIVDGPREMVRYCRIQAFPGDTFDTLARRIFKQIKIRVIIDGEEQDGDVSQIFEEAVTPDDVVSVFTRHFSLNEIPVIVVDEFNEITDKNAPNLFANTIKALSDAGTNVTMIIVGVADNVSELIVEHESIQRCVEQIPMPRMSNQDLLVVLETRLRQLDFTISGDAKWKMINLAKGLPAYIHGLGKHACLNALNSGARRQVEEVDVDAAIASVIAGSQQYFKDTYDAATRSYQPGNLLKQALTACAMAQTDEGGFFLPNAVKEPLSMILVKSVEIANFQNHLVAFIDPKRGAILRRKGEPRGYKFRFDQPAMQPYVLMRAIKENILSQEAMLVLCYPEQPELFAI